MADDRALHQLIDALPPDRKWTADKRARWLVAMERAVDYVVEVQGGAGKSDG